MARQHLKVAVAGAGVSGLVTAQELQREGQLIVVYEKSDQIGGTWVYDPNVRTDPLASTLAGKSFIVACMNLFGQIFLRNLWNFSDYQFVVEKNGKYLYFPDRKEMLKFLNDFAKDFGLTELIHFNTEVVSIKQKNGKWLVESKRTGDDHQFNREELFNAIVICDGHNTQPKLANAPVIHSPFAYDAYNCMG